MIRRIIHIDEEKCNGCGLCVKACHENAIALVNNKARLIRDDYCDGLGDCLPNCPTGAITFETREAAEYDAAAVEANKAAHLKKQSIQTDPSAKDTDTKEMPLTGWSLFNWPVQMKLAPIQAPYFDGASLLIAADCTAYAYAGFHQKFAQDKTVLIGCTKLDGNDYSEKLAEIFKNNNIKDVSVIRMEVPCCGGMTMAVQKALQKSGKTLPCRIVTLSIKGDILRTEE